MGREKLIAAVSQYFWHPGIASVAADVSRTCDHCQRVKVAGQPQPPMLKVHTSHPFELLTMDLISLPRTSSGNNCCLVCVDHNSKWLSVVPMRNKTAVEVAAALASKVLPCLIRLPEKILTDNGPEFRAKEFDALLDSYSIKHIRTTAYRPQGNGLCERTNRTITELLRNEGAESHNWDTFIPRIVILYNSSVHTDLSTTPSHYLLGREHSSFIGVPVPAEEQEYWKQGNPSFKPFRIGQLVLRKKVFSGNRVQDKLADRYSGPFEVISCNLNRVTYVVKHIVEDTEHKVHHTQLRRYYKPPKYLLNHSSYFRLVHGSSGEAATVGDDVDGAVSDIDELQPNFIPLIYPSGPYGAVDDSSFISSSDTDTDVDFGEASGFNFADYCDGICEVEDSYGVQGEKSLDSLTMGETDSASESLNWSSLANSPMFWSMLDVGSRSVDESLFTKSTVLTYLEWSSIEKLDLVNNSERYSSPEREITFRETHKSHRAIISRRSSSEGDVSKLKNREGVSKHSPSFDRGLSVLDLAIAVQTRSTPVLTDKCLTPSYRSTPRLPRDYKCVTGRVTRSQGAVEEEPWVQPRTLEYSVRSKV